MILVFVLLTLASLPIISVAAGERQQGLVLRHFVTLPAGLGAEGLVIHNGQFYVGAFSFSASDGTILVYNRDGGLTQQFTLPGLPQVGQLVFTDDETLVAVAGNLGTGHGSVVKIDLDSGKISTIASGFKLPNGIVVDRNGNLFVTDLIAGTVSKVTLAGSVSLFASGPLLAPAPIPGAGLTLGTNDLTFDKKQSALYVTNVGQGTIVKITIGKDGNAGAITKFATVPTPDGIAFDKTGKLFVTSPFTNSVWSINKDGSAHKLSINTTHESLNNPSNLAFHGRQLYITNLAIGGTGTIAVVTILSASTEFTQDL